VQFFSNWSVPVTERLLSSDFPLAFGFALAVCAPTQVSWWWRTGGQMLQEPHEGRAIICRSDASLSNLCINRKK
jgi:hypothetical protein